MDKKKEQQSLICRGQLSPGKERRQWQVTEKQNRVTRKLL